MATAAIVAKKKARERTAEAAANAVPVVQDKKSTDVSKVIKKVKARKSVFGMFTRKKSNKERIEVAKKKTMPLRVILHVLRQRRKDQLYTQLFFYFVFMCMYTFVIYHSHKPFHAFTQNFAITDVIVNEPFNERDDTEALTSTHDPRCFSTIGETDEVFVWLNNVVTDKLFPDGCENGGIAVQGQNYFVQQLQIRQGRTKQIEKDIRGTKFAAYPDFSSTNKDKDSNQTIYGEYKTGLSPIEGFPFGSGNTVNYGSEQYVTIMDPTIGYENITAKFKFMEENGWLDEATRVVVLDANFYNPTTDMVTAARFSIEILPQGYISSYYYSYTWPRSPHDLTDMVVLARAILEIYVFLFIMWLFFIEIKELIIEGPGKYLTLFNTIEFIAIIAMVGVILAQLYFESIWNTCDVTSSEYENWYRLGQIGRLKRNLVGFSMVMGWLKTFKFLEMNSKIKIIWIAIHNTRDDLSSTMMFFFILILGYGTCGFIIFGNQVREFSTFTSTVSWLLRALLGDLDYAQINEFNSDVAPVYFMTYIITVFFITLNLMIAIIIDGYEEAKQSILAEDDEDLLFIHDCLRSLIIRFTSKCKKMLLLRQLNKHQKSSGKISPEADKAKSHELKRSLSKVTDFMATNQNNKVKDIEMELQEVKKLNPAKVFKRKFGKELMAHYEQLNEMDQRQKDSMNRKEIFLSFNDLVAIDMTQENAAEVLTLYDDLAKDENTGEKLDITSHVDIPIVRQLAMAVDSMQEQMEFLMDQVDKTKKVPHPKSKKIRIHHEH